jgi:hypothetical protein
MSRKRILYIGTPFFNYYEKIIAEFEAKGYSVDYYNDRPSENPFLKGILKAKQSLMESLVKKYFDRIVSETKGIPYDIVFIVNCKVFTPAMIRELRDNQKSARFILYMWDSLVLYPNSKELITLFDKAYSFDSEDCEKNQGLTLLPLFYSKEFKKIEEEDTQKREYDIVSVCTAHPNRYKVMYDLFPKLESKGIRVYSYMYLNRLQYYYNRVLIPEFKIAKSSEFKFTPLSEEENLEVLKKSNTVFDMQHNLQSGLTMRTIETLGAKRKMITTNINIRKYDFYNQNNIYVMDKPSLVEIEQFIKHKYEPISNEIYKKYSLESWIDTIIGESEHQYLR